MAKKQTGVVRQPAALPVEWEKELGAAARDERAEVRVQSAWASIRAGVLKIGGSEIPGNRAAIVIVGHARENTYYPQKFSGDEATPPKCVAISRTGVGMAPDSVPEDLREAPTCDACPKNAFKSADNGKGKACRNSLKIAGIVIGQIDPRTGEVAWADLEQVRAGEVVYFPVPPTSLARVTAAIAQAIDLNKRPSWAMGWVYEVGPDPKNQVRVDVTCKAPINDPEMLAALKLHAANQRDAILTPREVGVVESAPAVQTPRRNKFRR